MNIAELLTEQQCDRQRVGDTGSWLWMLHQQGYPVCPTIVIPVEGWQYYQQALLTTLGLATEGVDWPHVAVYQAAVQAIQPPAQWLTQLTRICRTWPAPAIALHPVLVTTPRLPLEVQQLWRSQVCANTPQTITEALSQVWQGLVNVHSLAYYRHFQIPWSELQIAVLVQPLAQPLASGQLTLTSTTWQMETVWGCGYGWLPNCYYPDYYAGKRHSPDLTQHLLGSKHWVNHITPQGQLHHHPATTTEQNQWVLAIHEVQHLLKTLAFGDSLGSFLWQWLPNGRFEIIQGQVSVAQQHQGRAVFPIDQGIHQPVPLLSGQGVVTGSVLAPTFILTPTTTTVPPQHILVAAQLSTQQISLLSNAVGLILEQGTATSHAVIVARELQIPTVVRVEEAIAQLHNIRQVAIDGEQGHIYLKGEYIPRASTLTDEHPPPTTQIQVWGTVSHPQAMMALPNSALDGVGLIRAELLLLGLCPDPTLEQWFSEPHHVQKRLAAVLQEIVTLMTPRPVFYRFTDWCYPDFPLLPPSLPQTNNPAIGQRGMFAAQANPLIFDLELAAMKAVITQTTNFNLILPFVRRVAEVEWACDRLAQADIIPHQLWMMAEVPAVAVELAAYKKAGIQGVMIGLNDLKQLTLGIDRNIADLGQATDNDHPAVQGAIHQILEQAQALNLPCALCASLNWSEQSLVLGLVRRGITAIATDLGNVEAARWAIARAESAQQ